MKFVSLLASIATLATIVNAGRYTTTPKYHKGNRSAYAQKRVAETKESMELVYGKGLVGLKNPKTGRIDPKRFGQDYRRPATTWVEISGVTINAISWEAFAFGYVEGVQYTGISVGGVTIGEIVTTAETMSNCFYAVKGVIGSIETMVYDIKNLGARSGEYQWFNIAIFDPLHIVGDITVTYEMCNVYEDLDKLTGFFSMDWGLLGQSLTNAAIYIGYEAKDLLIDIAKNLGNNCQDEAIAAATQAVTEGLIDGLADYQIDGENEGETIFDVDALTDALEEAGSAMLDCVISDMNLYEVGTDLGNIMSRVIQAQLDPSD